MALLNEMSLDIQCLACVLPSWIPFSSFSTSKSLLLPQGPLSITSLRNSFQLFTFPLTFCEMQWFSLVMGLLPVLWALLLYSCLSLNTSPPLIHYELLAGRERACFRASLLCSGGTMHKLQAAFTTFPENEHLSQ